MNNKAQQATTATRAIGYVRVSTDEQHLGPEAQRAELESWCQRNGAELVAVHADLGVSGAAALDKRPGLLAALADLKRGAVLLVAKRDRLARDPMISAMVERMTERKGAAVVSAAGEGTDSDSPADVLMRRMVDAFAEYERLVIKARTSAALAVKRSKGERTGGDVPFGFQLGADGRTLEANAGERRALDIIQELRADGVSYRRIAEELNRRGVTTKRGASWTHRQVARAMSNAARWAA